MTVRNLGQDFLDHVGPFCGAHVKSLNETLVSKGTSARVRTNPKVFARFPVNFQRIKRMFYIDSRDHPGARVTKGLQSILQQRSAVVERRNLGVQYTQIGAQPV